MLKAIILVPFVLLTILSGPKVEVDQNLQTPNLSQDLDRYLVQSESVYQDIAKGAEKKIIWFDPQLKKKTRYSIVYLHGFSATRQETAPLSEMVAEELQANVFYTRLRGHGRSSHAMRDATVNDWLNDAYEALEIGRRLGEQVIIMGSSTGSTLATWLATREDTENILAVILMSPNYGPKDTMADIALWPWGGLLAHVLVGENYTWKAHNEDQEIHWHTQYPSSALLPMMGIVDLVRNSDLSRIKMPVLVLLSEQDQVIDPEIVKSSFSRFASKEKKLLIVEETGDPSHHILAGAIMSPNTTEKIAEDILGFLMILQRFQKSDLPFNTKKLM